MTNAIAIVQTANISRRAALPQFQKLTNDELVLLAYGEDRFGNTCDAPAWLAEMAYDVLDLRPISDAPLCVS